MKTIDDRHKSPLASQPSQETLSYELSRKNAELQEKNRQLEERIQQHRQTEAVLRESEGRFRALIEYTADIIMIIDTNGICSYVNLPLKKILGYKPEEMYGAKATCLIHPEDIHLIFETLHQASQNPDTPFGIPGLRVKHRKGHWLYAETTIINMLHIPGITGMVAHIRDITARHKAEYEREQLIENLRKARKTAERDVRLKSELLATMAHELRTPLNAIMGFSSILMHRMGVRLSQKAHRMVTSIHSNSQRLLDLINNFLEISRFESGQLLLVENPIKIQEMVNEWDEQIRVMAQNKQLDFKITIDPALPDTIYGDAENISKIALNLLNNAVKFTDYGSVHLQLSAKKSTWTITVTDTGTGIPPEAYSYIFDSFRQVDGSSRRKYGGIGLGLTIAQHMAQEMNGDIQFQSVLDKGSTFAVTLPIKTTPTSSSTYSPGERV